MGGLHWETASFANLLAHMGVRAPHTGEPYSEALLFGLSRGIGCMYFAFDHPGQEPYFFFNPRLVRVGGDATADLCRRLGLEADLFQTEEPAAAEAYLTESVKNGRPVMLWADRTRLPWGWAPTPGGPWMAPILVYGLEEGVAKVADRARVPLACPVPDLLAAWGAQPNRSHKALTLRPPAADPDLRSAVAEAISACVDGLLQPPTPNFGLRALQTWAEQLTASDAKRSWPALFRTDRLLFANLVRAYMYIELEGTGGGGARHTYAAFLDEAAAILGRVKLEQAAQRYRECGAAWTRLAEGFLPGHFRRVREVLHQREARFRAGGLPGSEESTRLEQMTAEADVPGPTSHRQQLHRFLLDLHKVEQETVAFLSQIPL